MKKIPTLYKKNPENLALVTTEVNNDCLWVFWEKDVKPTRKFDGTAAAIINGELYKRYDVKKGRPVPENAIPCQEPDAITGHWPHWVKCDRNKKEDKYFFEGLRDGMEDGTYELIGEKIQGNPEKIKGHLLTAHSGIIEPIEDYSFEGLREYLSTHDIEGIVFHHSDGRMCKIRKSDFGIKRITHNVLHSRTAPAPLHG